MTRTTDTPRALLLAILCLALSACGDACDSDGPSVTPVPDVSIGDDAGDAGADADTGPSLEPVARVEVDPEQATIEIGETLQLTASLFDGQDAPLTGREVDWRIVPAAVADVDSTGLVTAKAAGVARVRATAEGISAEVDLTVIERVVDRVVVEPGEASIKVNRSAQLTARAFSRDGTELARLITWQSSAPLTATVNPSGLVTGESMGTVTITAAADGVEGTATVTVDDLDVGSVEITSGDVTVEAGRAVTAQALARDEDGTPIQGRMFDWSVDDTDVAEVNAAGVVTGKAAGVASLTATLDGLSDTVSVRVTPRPVSEVRVAPATLTLGEGAQSTLTARTFDAASNELFGRTVTWTSNLPNIVSVDPNSGLVTGQTQGVADIIATSEGVMGTATITVLAGVDDVEVAPAVLSLVEGEESTFSATLLDAQDIPLTNRQVTWSTLDPGVATINQVGVLTAVAPGTTTVRATSEGVSGDATLTVTPKPVDDVTVTPDVVVLFPSDTQQLTSQVFDAAGDPLQGRTTTWSSSDPNVASVDANTGLVTAVGQGRAEITATVEGVTGRAEVVVAITFERIEAAGSSSCGTDTNGVDYCWGRNQRGVLGNGSTSTSSQTTGVPVDANLDFTSFTGRSLHMCGLTSAGEAYCWGWNDSGQIGNGRLTSSGECSQPSQCESPERVDTAETFDVISAGGSHTCAVNAAGAAYCWGNGSQGQVGFDPATPPANTNRPVLVAGSLTFSDVTAGGEHTCAISSTDGRAYCWGDNSEGQLGTAAAADQPTPAAVDSTETFVSIAAGPTHTCAVTTGGELYCWGCNADGQLGAGFIGTNGAPSDGNLCDALRTPQRVSSAATFTDVTVGSSHTCALTDTGAAFCWGANDANQRGDGSANTFSQGSPQAVSGGITFSSIDAGSAHTCAVSTQQVAYCWGNPFGGRLGDGVPNHIGYGSRLSRPFPVVIR
jgi:alpha-tubulin suppressor-like RCC1 family protein